SLCRQFFFFFQAEDGIRDGHVTGVQTCALPISSVANIAVVPLQDLVGLGTEARMNLPNSTSGNWSWRIKADALTTNFGERLRERSEERRVGKECRWRWWRYK